MALKEGKIYFTPIQEGSGTPSPENVRAIKGWDGIEVTRCGKNLCLPTIENSIKGLTVTASNNTAIINGKATSSGGVNVSTIFSPPQDGYYKVGGILDGNNSSRYLFLYDRVTQSDATKVVDSEKTVYLYSSHDYSLALYTRVDQKYDNYNAINCNNWKDIP